MLVVAKLSGFFSLKNSCEQEEATMGRSWYSEELNDWNIYQMFAHSDEDELAVARDRQGFKESVASWSLC